MKRNETGPCGGREERGTIPGDVIKTIRQAWPTLGESCLLGAECHGIVAYTRLNAKGLFKIV